VSEQLESSSDPPAPEEVESVDIHKPKAVHTWRAFFTEIGTIVIGILIALGLEQAVEAVHEHGLAVDAAEAIRTEMQENITRATSRLDQQACIDRRLNQIAVLLADWSAANPLPEGLAIGNPSDVPLVVERWQANLNSGRYSRQKAKAQAEEADFYTRVGKLNEILTHEHYAWSDLRQLELGPRVLTADVRPQLIAALQSARTDANDANQLGHSLLDVGKRAGLTPKSYQGFTIQADTCGPLIPTTASG
jgi:hypothetical protein